MNRANRTLLLDASINLLLGILLLAFSPGLVAFLGVPTSSTRFYPTLLGAVFVGIALALVIEAVRTPHGAAVGVGLAGAVAINLCGGLALAVWLIGGDLHLPLRGTILLWCLVALLAVLSGVELWRALRANGGRS